VKSMPAGGRWRPREGSSSRGATHVVPTLKTSAGAVTGNTSKIPVPERGARELTEPSPTPKPSRPLRPTCPDSGTPSQRQATATPRADSSPSSRARRCRRPRLTYIKDPSYWGGLSADGLFVPRAVARECLIVSP
jgi:hypothetical protein